jgi:hypothetical protein
MKVKLLGKVVAGLLLLALVGTVASRGLSALEDAPGKGGTSGPHYTVVETEGHNLIVTDNHANTLYFYTIDKGSKIGSELKLRGSVDLKQVGNDVIKPSNVKLQN